MQFYSKQDRIALSLLENYIKNGRMCYRPDQQKEVSCKELDDKRTRTIEKTVSLLADFFQQKRSLEVFKRSVDSINKRNRLWGFKGINGMMFFNMLYNSCQRTDLLESLHHTLINCLELPEDIDGAKAKIRRFVKFVGNINELITSRGISKRKAPKVKSSLFFLSYFWQIQDHESYPIFYNSLEIAFKKLGFLMEAKELDIYYESFFRLNSHLKDLFGRRLSTEANFWDVEHVFWHYYNSEIRVKIEVPPEGPTIISDEFLPPIVADLPLIARSDEKVKQKYPSQELENVFEDKAYHLFTFMKFDVEKIGRGIRGPDGIAKARENHYAIIYDCKCRRGKFTFHALDERTIIEYIQENKRALKKDGIERVYFLIISSDFNVSGKQLRKIKTSSGASSIILIGAEELLSILKRYLMDANVDKGDLEELFAITKRMEEQDIQEMLGA